MNLIEKLDQKIWGLFDGYSKDGPTECILRGIETHGIWVEDNKFVQMMFEALNIPAGGAPLLFIPWSKVRMILAASGMPSFREKSLNPDDPKPD